MASAKGQGRGLLGPVPGKRRRGHCAGGKARSEGAQFLLIPRTAFWWLDYYEGFRRHLAGSYRVAFRDEQTCMIIALHYETDPPDAGGAPDGLPLPPPELMAMTTGTYSARAFWESGAVTSGWIRKILSTNGLDIASFERILDFGSGCGRVMRYWRDLSGPVLSGADYNPYLVRWCRHNLIFADFQRVTELKPLLYEDETFDFIYSYSVFTHLDLTSERFWIDELQRLLRPGGFMYLTLRGARYADVLTPEERERFDAGEMVVQEEEVSGSNACLAHHPESYVRTARAGALRRGPGAVGRGRGEGRSLARRGDLPQGRASGVRPRSGCRPSARRSAFAPQMGVEPHVVAVRGAAAVPSYDWPSRW